MDSDVAIHPEIKSIIAKALSPKEYRELPLIAKPSLVDEAGVDLLMKKWEDIIVSRSGRRDVFEKRLKSLGFSDRMTARSQFAPRDLGGANVPSWAYVLQACIFPGDLSEAPLFSSWPKEHDFKGKIWFSNLTRWFSVYFHRRVQTSCPDWDGVVKGDALGELSIRLGKTLSRMAARAVASDVKQQASLGLLQGATPESRYDFYMGKIAGSAEGLLTFFQRYPVLARLFAVVTEQAAVNTITWWHRLVNDCEDISRVFFRKQPIKVANISCELSDAHLGGQTVWELTLEGGEKLFYKPRSQSSDEAYQGFLEWFNRQLPEMDLQSAAVLNRSGYGWVLGIPRLACQSTEEVAEFYRRQGAHLAIFYFLCGGDFHEGNFIPHGRHPVPIDLETLAGVGAPLNIPVQNPSGGMERFYAPNVLGTTMLPRWLAGVGMERESVVFSPLTEVPEGTVFPRPAYSYSGLGTDQLKITVDYREPRTTSALPLFEDQTIAIKGYEGHLLGGFQATYDTMYQHRDFLLSASGPMRALQGLPTRVVLRDTQYYSEILYWSLAPDHLTSGAAHDVALELVYGLPVVSNLLAEEFFPPEEKEALWRRDVPIFFGKTNDTVLISDENRSMGAFCEVSGSEGICRRLQDASPEDRDFQSELIRVGLVMANTSSGKDMKGAAGRGDCWERKVEAHLHDLGEKIAGLAMETSAGRHWGTLGIMAQNATPAISVSCPWYPTGTAGIAMVFSALAKFFDNSGWRVLALEGLRSAADLTARNTDQLALHTQGLTGLPMVIYSLLIGDRCFGEPDLIDRAVSLVTGRGEKWKEMTCPDYLTGTAATVAVLISLYERTRDERVLHAAQHAVTALLSVQIDQGPLEGAFLSSHSPFPRLGMGHGASGVAYALARYNQFAGNYAIEAAILRAIEFEQRHFNNERGDWPVYATTEVESPMGFGWCSGAVGIAISRMGIRNTMKIDPSILKSDLRLSLANTCATIGVGSHHLCCGEAGRAIALSMASRYHGYSDLVEARQRSIDLMLDFYEGEGFWKLHYGAFRSIIPGLSDGIGGIALALLAELSPEDAPDFLLLS